MHYHQFIGQVQHRARLADFEDAVRATRATLQTLGERLFGGEAGNLASQLPQEIGIYLTDPTLINEAFDLDEFFQRVAIREGADYPDAVFHATEVLSVVDEAVAPGLICKVCDQLPTDYDRLFRTCAEREGLLTESEKLATEGDQTGEFGAQAGGQGQRSEGLSYQASGEGAGMPQTEQQFKDFPLQE